MTVFVFVEPEAGVIARYEKKPGEKLKRTHRADAGKPLIFNGEFVNTFLYQPFPEFAVGSETVEVKKS
jgi:hypothetical protein